MTHIQRKKITHHYELRSRSRSFQGEANDSLTTEEFIKFFTKADPKKKGVLFQYNTRHKIEFIQSKNQRIEQKIKQSLILLKNKAPKYYSLFGLYNKEIRVGSKFTCADIANDTIDLCLDDIKVGTKEWLASALIHETIHFWQYASGMFDYKSDQAIELEAFKYQLPVLKQVGAHQIEINDVAKQRGTHYSQPGYQ